MKPILRIYGVKADTLYDYNEALAQSKFPFDLAKREFVTDIEAAEGFDVNQLAEPMRKMGYMGCQIETVYIFN